MKNLPATIPQTDFIPAEAQVAQQLTDQYRKAVSGTREVLIFGAMMMQIASSLELQTARPNQHTPKEETLKYWIEQNCPSINYKTACGFRTLAKAMREALAIPITTDIHHLLTAPVASLSKKEAKIRAEMDGAIDGKSAVQLEWDFGVRKARAALPPSGGEREGAGRPKFTHEKEQLQIESIFSKKVLGDISVAVLEKRWHLRLSDEKKDILAAIAMTIAEDLCDPTLRKAIQEARNRSLLVQP